MSISSRTPEGLPHRCPVCGKLAIVELSDPAGDTICPTCGQLLWWFRDRLGGGSTLQEWIGHHLDDLADSLDVVELVMELEEEFQITIPDSVAAEFRTLGDVIRYLGERLGDGAT
jgi:hypothetical protein